MNTDKVFDESGKGFTRVFSSEKVERVNPVEYYKNYELEKRATLFYDLLYAKEPLLALTLDRKFFLKKAEETLEGFFEKFQQTKINPNLEKVLITDRKKDQVSLLKEVTINPDELAALIFKAYTDHGYLFSRYVFENMPNGLEGKKLPKLFRLKEDGTIEKVGETDLTDGELKNVILHRKVIVSNFFEKEDKWHCFFITYDSIGGNESWKNGQAHFHYISSAFGITKEEFVESMRTGKYRSTSVHIDLLGYGNQTV
jgi:hypothetical protein